MVNRLLHGETVTVWRPTIAYDERKDCVKTWTPETVENVVYWEDIDEQ